MKGLLFCFALAFSQLLSAQLTGVLDSDFDGDGKVIRNYTSFKEEAYGLAIQPDGKILIGGTVQDNGFNTVLARFYPDGSGDNTFGTNGAAFFDFDAFNDAISSVIVLPDGKILVGGWVGNPSAGYDLGLIRYNPDGSIDETFGITGVVNIDFNGLNDFINSIVVMPDGKIIVVGEATTSQTKECAIARFNYNGTPDNSFSFDGKATTNFDANGSAYKKVLVQPDGKIVCIGYAGINAEEDVIIARYNIDGTLDQSFDGDGKARYDIANQASDSGYDGVLLAGGEIVVCGNAYIQGDGDFALLKVTSTGAIDAGFGNNGVVLTNIENGSNDFVFSMIVQPDGKFIAAGSTGGNVALVRYNADGSKDISFGNAGIVITDVLGTDYSERILEIALQGDGKLVACGTAYPGSGNDYQSFVLRYLTSLSTIGLIEFSPTETAPLLYPNPLQQTETLKYTLAEAEQISISLIDGQGKLVATFVENEKQVKGNHEVELNLPNGLPNGTYFIQIASPKGKFSIKAVK